MGKGAGLVWEVEASEAAAEFDVGNAGADCRVARYCRRQSIFGKRRPGRGLEMFLA